MFYLCYAKFRREVVIVFDGYPQKPRTKEHAHKSRLQSTDIGPDAQVTAITKLAIKKDLFLSNTRNKQNTINLFSEILVKKGFKTAHEPDDADTLTARAALSYSKEKQVKVIREDTDVLVLI